ncbi:hypothetical protein BLNAU_3735 [Blattamonas nauphoetae]|uniref:Uncharacterized protein n=1 Tax=Blattamonas nauphoetae TaxID=2049346 RepID=A0ABQ9YC28_9EUKA|nr:hypothetical protein BLNAU_3735 [Blattamonas nauphoetae]
MIPLSSILMSLLPPDDPNFMNITMGLDHIAIDQQLQDFTQGQYSNEYQPISTDLDETPNPQATQNPNDVSNQLSPKKKRPPLDDDSFPALPGEVPEQHTQIEPIHIAEDDKTEQPPIASEAIHVEQHTPPPKDEAADVSPSSTGQRLQFNVGASPFCPRPSSSTSPSPQKTANPSFNVKAKPFTLSPVSKQAASSFDLSTVALGAIPFVPKKAPSQTAPPQPTPLPPNVVPIPKTRTINPPYTHAHFPPTASQLAQSYTRSKAHPGMAPNPHPAVPGQYVGYPPHTAARYPPMQNPQRPYNSPTAQTGQMQMGGQRMVNAYPPNTQLPNSYYPNPALYQPASRTMGQEGYKPAWASGSPVQQQQPQMYYRTPRNPYQQQAPEKTAQFNPVPFTPTSHAPPNSTQSSSQENIPSLLSLLQSSQQNISPSPPVQEKTNTPTVPPQEHPQTTTVSIPLDVVKMLIKDPGSKDRKRHRRRDRDGSSDSYSSLSYSSETSGHRARRKERNRMKERNRQHQYSAPPSPTPAPQHTLTPQAHISPSQQQKRDMPTPSHLHPQNPTVPIRTSQLQPAFLQGAIPKDFAPLSLQYMAQQKISGSDPVPHRVPRTSAQIAAEARAAQANLSATMHKPSPHTSLSPSVNPPRPSSSTSTPLRPSGTLLLIHSPRSKPSPPVFSQYLPRSGSPLETLTDPGEEQAWLDNHDTKQRRFTAEEMMSRRRHWQMFIHYREYDRRVKLRIQEPMYGMIERVPVEDDVGEGTITHDPPPNSASPRPVHHAPLPAQAQVGRSEQHPHIPRTQPLPPVGTLPSRSPVKLEEKRATPVG